jgi:hypothetical protein
MITVWEILENIGRGLCLSMLGLSGINPDTTCCICGSPEKSDFTP